MKRREAIVGIAVLAAAAGRVMAHSGKIPRVGVLSPLSAKESAEAQREPFERGLRELGWIAGSNVLIEYRYAEGDISRLPALAGDLIRSGIDVIVARGNPAIHATRRATATIPIVMSAAEEPIAEGFVKSLSRPGANITGITILTIELDSKRLELLKEALPSIVRVAVLTNPKFDGARHDERMAALHSSARSLKLQLQMFEVTTAEAMTDVFGAIGRGKFDALLVRADAQIIDSNRQQVVELAAKHRIPAVYAWHFFPHLGGLMSYGPSLPGFHYRSATYVSRILKGANPAELAVEQPTKFDLVVNLKTAKAMGIEIAKGVLFRADESIR